MGKRSEDKGCRRCRRRIRLDPKQKVSKYKNLLVPSKGATVRLPKQRYKGEDKLEN